MSRERGAGSGMSPRAPFMPASDLPNEEPFDLRSEYVPTLKDISEQIGAVSSHLVAVHKECAIIRHDLGELREYVMADHAPRITRVEQEAKRFTLPTLSPGVKAAGKYGSLLLAVPTLLQILATLKPNLAGPIQQIVELFK